MPGLALWILLLVADGIRALDGFTLRTRLGTCESSASPLMLDANRLVSVRFKSHNSSVVKCTTSWLLQSACAAAAAWVVCLVLFPASNLLGLCTC